MSEARASVRFWGSTVRTMALNIHQEAGMSVGMLFCRRVVWEIGQVLTEVYDPAFAAEVLYAAADDIAGRKECGDYLNPDGSPDEGEPPALLDQVREQSEAAIANVMRHLRHQHFQTQLWRGAAFATWAVIVGVAGGRLILGAH